MCMLQKVSGNGDATTSGASESEGENTGEREQRAAAALNRRDWRTGERRGWSRVV